MSYNGQKMIYVLQILVHSPLAHSWWVSKPIYEEFPCCALIYLMVLSYYNEYSYITMPLAYYPNVAILNDLITYQSIKIVI